MVNKKTKAVFCAARRTNAAHFVRRCTTGGVRHAARIVFFVVVVWPNRRRRPRRTSCYGCSQEAFWFVAGSWRASTPLHIGGELKTRARAMSIGALLFVLAICRCVKGAPTFEAPKFNASCGEDERRFECGDGSCVPLAWVRRLTGESCAQQARARIADLRRSRRLRKQRGREQFALSAAWRASGF